MKTIYNKQTGGFEDLVKQPEQDSARNELQELQYIALSLHPDQLQDNLNKPTKQIDIATSLQAGLALIKKNLNLIKTAAGAVVLDAVNQFLSEFIASHNLHKELQKYSHLISRCSSYEDRPFAKLNIPINEWEKVKNLFIDNTKDFLVLRPEIKTKEIDQLSISDKTKDILQQSIGVFKIFSEALQFTFDRPPARYVVYPDGTIGCITTWNPEKELRSSFHTPRALLDSKGKPLDPEVLKESHPDHAIFMALTTKRPYISFSGREEDKGIGQICIPYTIEGKSGPVCAIYVFKGKLIHVDNIDKRKEKARLIERRISALNLYLEKIIRNLILDNLRTMIATLEFGIEDTIGAFFKTLEDILFMRVGRLTFTNMENGTKLITLNSPQRDKDGKLKPKIWSVSIIDPTDSNTELSSTQTAELDEIPSEIADQRIINIVRVNSNNPNIFALRELPAETNSHYSWERRLLETDLSALQAFYFESFYPSVLNDKILRDYIKQAIDALARRLTIHFSSLRHMYKERRIRYIDTLTRIFNRAYFNDQITHLFKLLSESKQGFLTILMIDVDNFKMVNDNLGHQKGDQVLKRIANILARVTYSNRSIDDILNNNDVTSIVARTGGEEFTIAIYDKNARSKHNVDTLAAKLNDAIQQAVQKDSELTNFIRKIRTINPQFECGTISVGVFSFAANILESIQVLSERPAWEVAYSIADEGLRIAKNEGRNQSFSMDITAEGLKEFIGPSSEQPNLDTLMP